MGMYTQIRGWLNVDSIGDYYKENYNQIKSLLEQAQNDFENDENILDFDGDKIERKWVCKNTILHYGGNGSCYIFFGTELKNYSDPAYYWIKYLLDYFPNAEGRIDFQYEEDEEDCRYLLIHKGSIIKDDFTEKWCKGYGNMWGE